MPKHCVKWTSLPITLCVPVLLTVSMCATGPEAWSSKVSGLWYQCWWLNRSIVCTNRLFAWIQKGCYQLFIEFEDKKIKQKGRGDNRKTGIIAMCLAWWRRTNRCGKPTSLPITLWIPLLLTFSLCAKVPYAWSSKCLGCRSNCVDYIVHYYAVIRTLPKAEVVIF